MITVRETSSADERRIAGVLNQQWREDMVRAKNGPPPLSLETELEQMQRSYAPPGHPEHIKEMGRLSCDGVQHEAEQTNKQVDRLIDELEHKFADVKQLGNHYKQANLEAAAQLISAMRELYDDMHHASLKLTEAHSRPPALPPAPTLPAIEDAG